MTPAQGAGAKTVITATADFQSALHRAPDLLATLHRARPTSLIVDSGDFFQGPYYPVTRGAVEERTLTELYDVIAAGNHGWPHYTGPLRDLTVCANVIAPITNTLREHRSRPPRRPTGDRPRPRPAPALRQHHQDVDAWVLLSHHGYRRDRDLASRCPFRWKRAVAMPRPNSGALTSVVVPPSSGPVSALWQWPKKTRSSSPRRTDGLLAAPRRAGLGGRGDRRSGDLAERSRRPAERLLEEPHLQHGGTPAM